MKMGEGSSLFRLCACLLVPLPVLSMLLLGVEDLDEEEGNLYWSFQEFCVLKFRKGVEDQQSQVQAFCSNPFKHACFEGFHANDGQLQCLGAIR